MFREQLHKDLDGISPDEELLNKVTKMMQEEAQNPRPNVQRMYIRYAGMAAAVCMIAVGTIALSNSDNLRTGSVAEAPSAMAMDATANEAEMNESVSDYSLGADAESFTADIEKSSGAEACAEEACDALPEEDGTVIESEIIYEEFSDKKGITTAEAVYKGNACDLSYDQAGKLIQLAVDYAEENPMTMLDLALPVEEYKNYGENGLSLYITDTSGRKVRILISRDEALPDGSMIGYNGNFYSVSDELKEEILGYFE